MALLPLLKLLNSPMALERCDSFEEGTADRRWPVVGGPLFRRPGLSRGLSHETRTLLLPALACAVTGHGLRIDWHRAGGLLQAGRGS